LKLNVEVLPPAATTQMLPLLHEQAMWVVESLQGLCHAVLRAASTTVADLQCADMVQIRRSILECLDDAEGRLSSGTGGPPGALLLAEEFEDFTAMVKHLVAIDRERLDAYMERSIEFRTHALRQFLDTKELQPLFFQAIEQFKVPQKEIDELLAPHPELRWTLELTALSDRSSEGDWEKALQQVEKSAVKQLQREPGNAVQRDAFAALALLARAAAGLSNANEDCTVSDPACIGRLQADCEALRREQHGPEQIGRGKSTASAEDCIFDLAECMQTAATTLRAEGREGRFFDDVARAVRLTERGLCERGIDLEPLLLCESLVDASSDFSDGIPPPPATLGRPATVARALQRVWAGAVFADESIWQQVLVAPEGRTRDGLVASTGFFRMACWKPALDLGSWKPPRSADPTPLSSVFPQLRPFAPALRLALADAAKKARHSESTVNSVRASVAS